MYVANNSWSHFTFIDSPAQHRNVLYLRLQAAEMFVASLVLLLVMALHIHMLILEIQQ